MANPEHLKILNSGMMVWNEWRSENKNVQPDFSGADLRDEELIEADFSGADLSRADLRGSDLTLVDLSHAILVHANFSRADLSDADLSSANLGGADFAAANLSGAILMGANFTNAYFGGTTFTDNDLSQVRGLETAIHYAPSSIGIDTLYKSAGKISESFLRDCGVPDDFIAYIPSQFGIQQAIQFYSCFISYSTKDEEFARRMCSRLRYEKLRVWFAPEDIKGGQKVKEQIERAIQIHDRLLIVLSESSLQSNWVMTEIRRARKVELRENRRKLFPIRLVGFDALQAWECFDADTGEDLAAEVRQYFIPDFSNWKDHDSFERAFERLLRDLRAEEKKA